MTNALTAKFVELKESDGKKMSFDADVCELIYGETNGHVGAVRTLLSHFVSTDKRSRQDVIDFTRRDVYQTDLSAYRSFLSVSEATIRQLGPDDRAVLVQCIVLYKQGSREFSVKKPDVAELVKLGIFVNTSPTAIGAQTKVAFPSPLHFDLALYNVLHRTVELRQTTECFEQDMYINAGFQWGIKLIREGDGRPAGGTWRAIHRDQTARIRSYQLHKQNSRPVSSRSL
jgi:hypothetical protein